MTRILLAVSAVVLVAITLPAAPRKKKAKKTPPVHQVTAAEREAARDEIAKRIRAAESGFENPEALTPFLSALKNPAGPIHILQFGDSHTASDDWVNSMRTALQAKFGDGGPGFVHPGRPFRGYRRFDAQATSSLNWRAEGTMALLGDGCEGLSGISISTGVPGQTIGLSAAGDSLSIFFLQQPGGGRLELTVDAVSMGSFSTDGEPAPGVSTYSLLPGPHQIELRTLDRAPVRLFGWTLDNTQGATFETLGINGAQAHVILGWNEAVWDSEVAERNPALVILAYGTNEANSHRWTLDDYRISMKAVIERVRRAAPQAGILMIGPPDCGKSGPLLHLTEVIDAQRQFAREENVAFWDWRRHMGGPGSIRLWVTAGYGQADYIHMTGEGYRIVGDLIVNSFLENQNEQARQNH
jgi:lysophospholipase L1-like esterase